MADGEQQKPRAVLSLLPFPSLPLSLFLLSRHHHVDMYVRVSIEIRETSHLCVRRRGLCVHV